MPPRLSIVVPFHDEADSLPTLYAELGRVLSKLTYESEMIFVDDASRDGSRMRLLGAVGNDARVRVLSISPHSGQSAALEAGFRMARGEIIATLDADLQNDPADLPRLLAALDTADCVNGIRTPRRDGLSKRLASRFANALRRRVLKDGVRDIGCSLPAASSRRTSGLASRRVKVFLPSRPIRATTCCVRSQKPCPRPARRPFLPR